MSIALIHILIICIYAAKTVNLNKKILTYLIHKGIIVYGTVLPFVAPVTLQSGKEEI